MAEFDLQGSGLPDAPSDGTTYGRNNAAWLAITGGGDMLGSANLSDVASVSTSRTNLGVDVAGTDNSTNVTLSGTGTYISIAGQVITVDPITESDIADLGAYITGITGSPLSDLSDVTITTIATGEVLKWDGLKWINQTLAEAGISATGHSHIATDVTDFDTEVSNNASVTANTAKNSYPTADSTKVGNISVTQPVDLDTIESDTATNNAKTSDINHVASSTTTDLTEGTNLYYTESRVAANSAVAANTAKNSYPSADATKLAGIEASADVTDTANVTAAGAVMDSELINTSAGVADASKPIKLDASGVISSTMYTDTTDHTTLSNIGTNTHAQIDTHLASTANPHSVTAAQVGADPAGTDNSTNVTLSGTGTYLSIAGQVITQDPLVATDVTDFDTEVSNNASVTANTAKVGVTTEISNIVEDLTPQLGADLDTNGKHINAGANDFKIGNTANSAIMMVRSTGEELELFGAGSGQVSINGTTTQPYILNFNGTMQTTGNTQVVRAVPKIEPTGTIANLYGINNNINIQGSSAFDITKFYGQYVRPTIKGAWDGTLGTSYGVYVANGSNTSTGTASITNQYGFYTNNLTLGTNNYSYYGGTTSGTNRWNLYMSGSADNYLNGNLGIGTATPAQALDVVGNIAVSGTVDGIDIATDVAANTAKTGVTTEISNVVEDLTPQLGGNLDVNGKTITGAIALDSSGDVTVDLGDAVGANKLKIQDSASAEVLSVDSDGNMAFGGITPEVQLHLPDTGELRIGLSTDAIYSFLNKNSLVFHRNGNNYVYGANTSGTLRMGIGNITSINDGITVKNGGNVGINDQTPSYDLDVNGDIRATGKIISEAETEVTYLNSWVAYDSTQYYGWYYMKDSNGTVHLRGLGKNGSSKTATMFTLPTGYRPPARLIFSVTSSNAHARVDIQTDGTVSMVNGGTTGWVSLSGISFKV